MPKIYRSMHDDGGKPRTSQGSCTLGVRVPGGEHKPDIEPDPDGNVLPGTGGMSVAPSLEALLRELPTYLPKRLRRLRDRPDIAEPLRTLLGRAAGSNSLRVWVWGEGAFSNEALNAELALRVDRPDHGMVEPARVMSLEAYEVALASTQGQWSCAEPVEGEPSNA